MRICYGGVCDGTVHITYSLGVFTHVPLPRAVWLLDSEWVEWAGRVLLSDTADTPISTNKQQKNKYERSSKEIAKRMHGSFGGTRKVMAAWTHDVMVAWLGEH